MNWKKLKNSLLITGFVLLLNNPDHVFARLTQPYSLNSADTLSQKDTEKIVEMVLQHLNENDPSSFSSYSAISLEQFSVKNLPSGIQHFPVDTTETSISQHDSGYLYSTEILSTKKYLKPGFYSSDNLSAKSTGKEQEIYSKLANQLKEISLLQPTIHLLNKRFISPFQGAALPKYNYTVSVSVSVGGDSIYTINFHPKPGDYFDGFTGTAIIDAKKYAVRQIKAHSTRNISLEPLVVIHQNFETQDGRWLPSDKKIKILISNFNNQVKTLYAESTTQIYQQLINPPFTPGDFEKSSSRQGVQHGEISNIQDQQAKLIRMIAEGKIPMGYFHLDYNKIFGYNLYEGIKPGMGIETTRLISRHFTVGGYFSYGLKNKSVQHGEWINIYPSQRPDLRIHLGYKDMNLEFGGPEFLETKSLLNPESYRNLLIKNMFTTKRYTTGVEFRPINDLNIYLFGDHSENYAKLYTPFLQMHAFDPVTLTRTGLQLRFAPEIKLEIEDGRLNEIKEPRSDYYVTFIQGLGILGGESRYTKLEFKGKFNLPFKGIGATTIMLRGGTISQNGPIIELFNGYGSFAGTFTLAAPYSFATMQLNEFGASEYSALHLRHNFSPWLFGERYTKKPAFIFAQNIGVGRLNDQYKAQFNLTDYREGFFESGIEINNLLRMNFLSWGAGVYYRYGPYRLSRTSDNFAYKFGFYFNL